ncbi:MAG: hypothetical protein V4722_22535 [Bacteroidota bacterium]
MKYFLPIIFLLFLAGCNSTDNPGNNQSSTKVKPDTAVHDSIPSTPAKVDNSTLVLELAEQVLISLKNKDYRQFAAFFHPVSGVRFSPYGYVDTAHDVKLTADQFLAKIAKGDRINWGTYDGSGDPIILSVQQYIQKFVYNADFLSPETMNLNKTTGGGSNAINNLEIIYKGCEFTEHYFSGFDKKYNGMDWTSLRLVFKSHNNLFYLVGIVHGQWTI